MNCRHGLDHSDCPFLDCVPGPILNDVLAELGLTTSYAGNGQKDILRNGEILYTGTPSQVWAWLEEYEAPAEVQAAEEAEVDF